ncbi:MAG: hypothetical protein IPM64_00110 [Phycisphaerales bacterium]|nr:hypothetical protein [Phycisphaerales bacterium]
MTERDQEILEILTRRVRVLSLSQVAATWWPQTPNGQDLAKARLKELERLGLIRQLYLLARPEPPLNSPIVTWKPGAIEPSFGAVAYQLRSRWTRPARRVLSAIATERAGIRFAGTGGRTPRASEATHDLCLATVYLRLRTTDSRRARRWVSEAALYEQGEGRDDRLPDAVIVTRSGKTAIEFGGAYPPAKVAAFHAFCAQRGWGYELW